MGGCLHSTCWAPVVGGRRCIADQLIIYIDDWHPEKGTETAGSVLQTL